MTSNGGTPGEALKLHPALRDFMTPLSQESQQQLTANLLADGCRDALVIWQEEHVLLDGHHRFAICQQYGLPHDVTRISLPNLDAAKAWMIANQLGRRNLTPEQASYWRGKERELVGTKVGRPSEKLGNNCLIKTDEQLAEEHKVSQRTIKNDAAFARNVDTIATIAPEARDAILARDTKLDRQDVKALATIAKDSPQAAKHILVTVQSAPTPKAAKATMRAAVKARPKVNMPVPPLRHKHDTPRVKTARAPAPVLPLALVPDAPPRKGIDTLLAADGREMFIVYDTESHPTFNKTNEMVDWAAWTWNPVTGCWHDCHYCYARDIANRASMAAVYPKQFEPTFYPARLNAPANTPYPKEIRRPADTHVFVGSMTDLFGRWVPEEWITQVFERVRLHPEWNFLFLTKFPQRLKDIGDLIGGFPTNAWLGCTVDTQARVTTAERAFAQIEATVRWLSVEPMLEPLTFHSLAMFDWLVIGGQSASAFNGTPDFQPEWAWVEHLWQQARTAGLPIYWKENLTVRPKETPWTAHHEAAPGMLDRAQRRQRGEEG